jgi:hypothetical protein
MSRDGNDRRISSTTDSVRLTRAAEALRTATADAHASGSWFAPTLDDCRLDADRLLSLGNNAPESSVHAVLVRADLALRTWNKLVAVLRHHHPSAPSVLPSEVPTPSPGTVAAIRARRCPFCESGTLWPVAKPGRTAPFRGVRLEIPATFAIPTCDHCGAEALDPETAARLDDVLLSAWTWRQR